MFLAESSLAQGMHFSPAGQSCCHTLHSRVLEPPSCGEMNCELVVGSGAVVSSAGPDEVVVPDGPSVGSAAEVSSEVPPELPAPPSSTAETLLLTHDDSTSSTVVPSSERSGVE